VGADDRAPQGARPPPRPYAQTHSRRGPRGRSHRRTADRRRALGTGPRAAAQAARGRGPALRRRPRIPGDRRRAGHQRRRGPPQRPRRHQETPPGGRRSRPIEDGRRPAVDIRTRGWKPRGGDPSMTPDIALPRPSTAGAAEAAARLAAIAPADVHYGQTAPPLGKLLAAPRQRRPAALAYHA